MANGPLRLRTGRKRIIKRRFMYLEYPGRELQRCYGHKSLCFARFSCIWSKRCL